MANWCENSVHFSGEESNLERLKADASKLKKGDDLFTALTDYKGERDSDKVLADDIIIEELYEYATIHFNSAWNPPTGFVQKVCAKYGLEGFLEYKEPGMDFAGEVTNPEGEIVEEIKMTYKEAIFKDDDDYFFYDFCLDVDAGVWESEEDIIETHAFLKEIDEEDTLEKMLEYYRENM